MINDDHAAERLSEKELDIQTFNELIKNKCERHQWIVGLIDAEDDLILFECNKCHIQHEIRGYFEDL